MGYIGPSPNPGQNREVDDISSGFNGSEVNFTLQVTSQNVSPGSANAIIISLGGVVQNPGTDYTIAASTLTFTTAPASGLSFFGLVLGQSIDTEGTADGSITLTKFVNGTSSNNGKFLRANNGAIPSFETVTGTTINNNADNRVITGSGTANTLEGESGLTFDGDDLDITKSNSSMRLTVSSNTPKINFNANSVSDAARITIAESGGGGVMKLATKPSGGSLTERLTVDSTGRVGIGTTTPDRRFDVIHGGTYIARVQQTTNNQGEDHACITLRHAAATSGQNGVGMIFQNTGGSVVGKIDFGQSTTQYRTSSDYRLKENAVPISDGITRLKTLKPYRFNFIAEPDRKVDGFFAHEVTAVPEAIGGTKDEVETTYYKNSDTIPEGKAVGDVKDTASPVYQGIDQSKLVPLLTAALQEAITKIETLETKVAALEAA